ncbi:thrombospondin type 3 repeat-containing protein [Thalassotalea sp. LPB0316]|nr:thrombospondin type 3 repeat-containing protein [Thalassotalea sp. LPB0316]
MEAPAQSFIGEGQIVSLMDFDALTFTPWTAQELNSDWAMPIKLDFAMAELPQPLSADIVNFAENNTGTTAIFGLNFTWLIDADGVLVITLDSGEIITLAKEAVYDTGVGVFATYTVGETTYTNYSLVVAQNQIGDLSQYTDLFLQNSFSLTDPGAYDEDGMLRDDRVFGWRLENNDNLVTRITNGDFDLSEMFSGWDRWFWEFTVDGQVKMTSLRSEYGSFADCDPESDDYCAYWRIRYWQPLATIGDRIYVLEWEEINDNAYSFPAEPPVWRINIPPRVQFYQVMDIDSDGDGITDALDPDNDNDGVNDQDDEFPFDSSESMDSDGDSIGNNADKDDDNDGVYDEDDAFPLDPLETADTDMDGIGDNSDPDIDGDGALNEEDVAPYDAQAGSSVAFSTDDLLSGYVRITESALANPAVRLGVLDGTQYLFDQGVATKSDSFGSQSADYLLENDVLTIYFQGVESSSYENVSSLINRGMITPELGEAFIEQHGDYQVLVSITTSTATWQQLESSAPNYRFWQTQLQAYLIVDDWEREQLTGSLDQVPFEMESAQLVELIDLASLPSIAWVAEDLTDNWTIPVNIDFANEVDFNRKQMDIVSFNENGTALSDIFTISMDWTIDENGILMLSLADNITVSIEKVEQFDTGVAAIVIATDGMNTMSSYEFLVPAASNIDISPVLNSYLMGSFTLTNPDAYDNGMIQDDAFFGYRLETGGDRATRILNGNFDFNNERDGWDRWLWSLNENNDIVLNALWQSDFGVYQECDWVFDDNCNRWRIRTWRPLQLVGNRLYVLEWEERNNFAFDIPSMAEELTMAIAPRINFYEVYDIDSDKDGILDSVDPDDDNDGIDDENDAYPFDIHMN